MSKPTYPNVRDVVEAWVETGWYWVYWDGVNWRFYPSREIITTPILRWRYVPMGGVTMTHINSISCGQGAPSLFLIVLAGEGAFPADVVIVADTGWENDMMRNDGRRTTAREFFEEVTKPLANSYGIDAAFVRAIDGDGNAKMAIPDDQRISNEKIEIDIPLYGSRGGRLMQSCTSKWKVGAIRQELRRRGATTAMTALGLHRSEAHRIKPSDVDWQQSCWPLCDIRQDAIKGIAPMGIGRTWDRASVYTAMERAGVPYLISSECDGCPHKDFARWQRTSPETIEQLAAFEAQFGGEFFLTKYRKPLREALALMRSDNEKGANLFDICDSGYCFV